MARTAASAANRPVRDVLAEAAAGSALMTTGDGEGLNVLSWRSWNVEAKACTMAFISRAPRDHRTDMIGRITTSAKPNVKIVDSRNTMLQKVPSERGLKKPRMTSFR